MEICIINFLREFCDKRVSNPVRQYEQMYKLLFHPKLKQARTRGVSLGMGSVTIVNYLRALCGHDCQPISHSARLPTFISLYVFYWKFKKIERLRWVLHMYALIKFDLILLLYIKYKTKFGLYISFPLSLVLHF